MRSSTGFATFGTNVRFLSEIYGSNGSSTAASIRFWDANTGLYHPGSDALGIITSGGERMRIKSSITVSGLALWHLLRPTTLLRNSRLVLW